MDPPEQVKIVTEPEEQIETEEVKIKEHELHEHLAQRGAHVTRILKGDRDHIAQLVYEVYLVCLEEKQNYGDTIAIYGNYATWHLFWMDFSLV